MDGKLFLTAAALLLVAACTKEDSRAAFRSDPDAVRITAQVGDGLSGGFVTTRSNPVSEAPEEQKAFKSGDKVCVTANGQKKVVYTYDGTAWNPEAGKYLKWTSPKMTFSACYPAADGVSATHFTVPADQSDEAKIAAADYMTFSAEVTRGSNNGVTLGLTRKMARIVVEPAIQNQFGGEYYVSELKVHGNRKGYSGGNLVDGEVAVKAYKLNGKFYALLPPSTEAADAAFIDVTVTKDGVSETLQAKGIPATTAGNSYTVSLTVGKNVASVTDVSVSPWNTSSDITGGEAVLVPYITFTAEAEQTFKMDFGSFTLGDGEYFEYSVNGGKWVQFTSTISDENAVAFGGPKGNLRLRGKSSKGTATGPNNYSTISFGNTTKVSCKGDIRTLINYENYVNESTANARFYGLFEYCKLLATAPDLPATELADYCYGNMFYDCHALTSAPKLPALTLASNCYASMFYACIALTKAPDLPATTLAEYCYSNMFCNCTNLISAPTELPATTLASFCYEKMFRYCYALTEAPVLPATKLLNSCYTGMFQWCKELKSVTMKATDVSAASCLYSWLTDAGTEASSRTLTVANADAYTAIESSLPEIWKDGASGTTIVYNSTSSSGE